ncbi:NAD-dependent epimerase/dehydratase family protein [Rhizobium rhizophilum]|uniref:NAD-dependent epimerase/dehydratase family protein n=1 Tax=Rhizobium rhizophilum TaxID=1850373 RepID=A0ABY2QN27_9HYPH|nr:NAD-dependent epimerase/dehydratase family protein [Rhizobium rhizophilum]THV10572.1 NAD-dependent epimerase/dehydratase family protein [Rhizobium rhizophilum]
MLLVTGGNGFIGTDLARGLKAADLPFRLAARRSAREMIGVGNVNSTTDWSVALKGVATVIHLAGLAHQISRPASLEEFRVVNVDGSANLARQSAEAGARRFVFVSSIGVLGQTTTSGLRFSDKSPPNPVTPYALSKHEAEEALKRLCSDLGMELVILRPPLVYGASARGNFGRLVGLVKAGCPLPLLSIKNQRSMVSVGSLTRALITCATKPKAANETFVVADMDPVSTPDVITAIAKGLRRKPHLFPFPPGILEFALRAAGRTAMAEGLLSSLAVDSSQIAARLDWVPEAETLKAIEAQFTSSGDL